MLVTCDCKILLWERVLRHVERLINVKLRKFDSSVTIRSFTYTVIIIPDYSYSIFLGWYHHQYCSQRKRLMLLILKIAFQLLTVITNVVKFNIIHNEIYI